MFKTLTPPIQVTWSKTTTVFMINNYNVTQAVRADGGTEASMVWNNQYITKYEDMFALYRAGIWVKDDFTSGNVVPNALVIRKKY